VKQAKSILNEEIRVYLAVVRGFSYGCKRRINSEPQSGEWKLFVTNY